VTRKKLAIARWLAGFFYARPMRYGVGALDTRSGLLQTFD
jgi:hypothetical protein